MNLCQYDKNECPPKRGKSKVKDTKHWCRGKEGVRHAVSWKPTIQGHLRSSWFDLSCDTCGKKFAYWFDSTWGRRGPLKDYDQKCRLKLKFLDFVNEILP